ncbi:multicopper oxidase domain-containing protein [Nocardioides massiliensis]|uniref:Copper-containing nitrite reductase n=1 Tax=Nocardioides massiliensis TaxID=1325935 RepID=A0ABT9NND2_9ACTN|nr:multicopper oxidase domain-containing protein [Nocardioides massiliensis]MDP9821944.1 nitrite reductase (NO-forming) [Nocardioides massiliensis]
MRRGFSPLRDLPALVWLTAIPVVAFAHPWIPEPRWLLVHLLLLGAATHSIVVWSQHFADALLRVPSVPRPALLGLLNLGALTVMVGTQTVSWQVTSVGASAVAGAALWHAARLAGQLRRALPVRFAVVVRYYVAAALLLPVGAALGVLLVTALPDPWHGQVLLAHVALNLLGWVGMTVAGTVMTLWPTILRTRLGAGSDAALRRALPLLLAAVLVTAVGCLVGLWPLAAAGLTAYGLGWLVLGVPLAEAARRKPPTEHPAWSMGAGVVWLIGCLVAWAYAVTRGGEAPAVLERFEAIVPFLATGFVAQVLVGALGYLVPSALGGGGRAVRAANEVLNRAGAFRVTAVNLGLLVCALPAPSLVRVLCSLLVLLALAAQIPLLVLAIRASRRARRTAGGPPLSDAAQEPVRRRRAVGSAVAGAAAVMLAVASAVALDPTSVGTVLASAETPGVPATGETTTVRVEAGDMRFTPSRIEVPAGDRLVIEVVNTDTDVHDLVLENGERSGRISPGETARVVVDLVGRDLEGWCSLVGHRQMGMTLDVVVTGGLAADDGTGEHAHHGTDADDRAEPAAAYDPAARPDPGFRASDPTLAPLRGDGPRTRRLTLTVSEVEREVAPGVTQRLWTYNGGAPGPTLHGRVGDEFVITLVNDGTIGHSIDFHAGALAPDRPMRTIGPGESLTYRFTAERAGIWMYHCSTMPMSAHIANGMFGAVVIEPPGLPPVDRSLVLVQGEHYYGPQGGVVDADELAAERPDAVVFNGYADQYFHDPVQVRVGERIRIWVLAAGPNRGTSFHVVGGQFATTYAEGAYLLRDGGPDGTGGAQALALAPAQGGFVELTLPEAGNYPFVSHAMVDAERGARGVLEAR